MLSMLIALGFLIAGMISGDVGTIGAAGMYLVAAGFIVTGILNN